MSVLADKLRDSRNTQVLVELEYEGETIRAAYQDISIPYAAGDPKLFKGIIAQPFTLEFSFDFITSTQPTPRVDLTFTNDGRLQDKEVLRVPDSGYGTIYIWAPGCDWADIEEDGAIFKGRIRKRYYTKSHYALTLVGLADKCMTTVPPVTINDKTWPNHRPGFDNGVSSQPVPLLYGHVVKGAPLYCVDTVAFKHVLMYGISSTTDGGYDETVLFVYKNNLVNLTMEGFPDQGVFYPGYMDGEGNPCAVFDFLNDTSANEPLTCDALGSEDATGEFSGMAGTLIDHPADIAHHLLVNFGVLNIDDVDRGSFSTVRNQTPELRYGTIINKQEDGQAIIRRLFKHVYLCLAQRGAKLGCFALQPKENVEQSLITDTMDVVSSRIKFSRTPHNLIINNLYAFGNYHGQQGSYMIEGKVDHYNNRDARDSKELYGETPQKILYMPDAQTSEMLYIVANRHMSINAQQHDLIETNTPYWQAIDYKIGDISKLTTADGSSVDGTGWTDEPCILIGQRFEIHSIKCTWWRIGT